MADYERIETFSFLEKQIENIINLSNFHNNILFIVNKKSTKEDDDKGKHKQNVEGLIKSIHDKYNISPVFMDISKFCKNDKNLSKFIQKVYARKIGEKSSSDKKKANKNSGSKNDNTNTTTVNISSSKFKYNASNTNITTSSPFFDKDVKFDISKKRTQSVKRNLSEVFKKLNLTEN
jgi:hypothetical protein